MSVTAFDETLTTADGDVYGFMLAPGNQGFSSTSNPFAVKATQGDRSYSDYDAQQALAMSDLSGGIGQDRLVVPTKYWTGKNIDTRGKRVILGPEQHFLNTPSLDANVAAGLEAGLLAWHYIYTGGRSKMAARLGLSTDVTIDHYLIYLRATVDASTITVSLCNDDAGVPGSVIDAYTVPRADYDARGKWVEITPALGTTVSLSSESLYWVMVEHSGVADSVAWGVVPDLTELSVTEYHVNYYNGSAWVDDDAWAVLWIESAITSPDTFPTFLVGAGEDEINRVWMWAGRRLYYITASSGIACVVYGGTYEFPNEITDACFYKGTGDSHRYLYIALGGTDMVKFDCNITGTPTMSTVTGSKATRLCVHDNKLWRYYNGAVQYSTDGSTWAGSAGEIGDSSYTARKMVSWDGSLWVGCDDGLFKVVYGTALTVVRQIDLTAQASPNNFSFMTVHQADLWFSLGEGIIRYTNGDVVVPMTPSTGADQEDEERFVFRAAYSTLTTLFVVGIGAINNESSILAYAESGWHPIVTFARTGDECVSLAIDPALYGPIPRLWFSAGLQVGYVKMPTMGQLRWTYDVDYAETGELLTSWFDGNLMTIEKDWSAIEVDAERVGEGAAPNIQVYYRTQEGGTWTLAGTVTEVGYTAMALASPASHSTKIQLKVVLNRGTWLAEDDTPHLLGLVIRYLERPAIIHTHTRTYRMGPHTHNRIGTEVQKSLAQQITDLRTLASEAEALTWRTWYGATYQVAIMMYNATEIRNEVGGNDVGYVLVSVRLQEI